MTQPTSVFAVRINRNDCGGIRMGFNEYQRMQLLTFIYLVQELGEQQGLNNLNYVTEEQMKDLTPLGIKYQDTPLDKQITSIREMANKLYESLTSTTTDDELPTRPEVSD